jgi:NADH:ubiquinone oxidoreductase subunit F (NADH-binding)
VLTPTGATVGLTSTWTNINGIEILDQKPSGAGTNTLSNVPVAILIDSQTYSGAYAIKQTGSGIVSLASQVQSPGLISTGSAPTGTTGTCTASSFVGGTQGGKFAAALCAGGTIILSGLPTAPNGYTCAAQDQTTPADTLKQTAFTATSVTFTATTAASDVVAFQCTGF